MSLLFYQFECGCKVTPEEVCNYKIWARGENYRKYRCPEYKHGLTKLKKTYLMKCEMCGKKFEGPLAAYCPDCRIKRKRTSAGNYAKTDRAKEKSKERRVKANKAPNPKKSMALYDPDRWACKHRSDCLTKYEWYACLPCRNCPDYVLQHGNNDPLEYKRTASACSSIYL